MRSPHHERKCLFVYATIMVSDQQLAVVVLFQEHHEILNYGVGSPSDWNNREIAE